MRVLLIGAQGQLGGIIFHRLAAVHRIIKAPSHDILDITDLHSTEKFIEDYGPNIIVNCSAVHDTKVCQEDPEKARMVNTIAVGNLSNIADQIKAKLFHFSTDQVLKAPPNLQDEDVHTYDYDVYSQTKREGELVVSTSHTIIRISALFGHDFCRGKNRPNFVEQIIQVIEEGRVVGLPSNLGCSPGYAEDIAKIVARLTRENNPLPHIIHLAPADLMGYSWYSFGIDVVDIYGRKSKGFRHITRAHRSGPSTGLVNMTSRYNYQLPPVRNALGRYIKQRKKSKDNDQHSD